MKRRIFSAVFAIIMAFSLCIGSVVPATAAGTAKPTITAVFEITNDLAEEMTSLKLSEEGIETWGKELLSKPLKSGGTVKIPITYTTDKLKWDIMAITENGELVFPSLDFKGITAAAGGSIHLRYSIMKDTYGLVYNNAGAPTASQVAGKSTITVTFNVKNETLGEFESLQLSPIDKAAWGANLLKGPLAGGATVKIPITFTTDTPIWDLRVTDAGGEFVCQDLDFSQLTPATGGNIALRYSMAYGNSATVSSNVVKTPYPKQSGNVITFFDTDSDGVLSAYETKEQVAAANPNSEIGYEVTISEKIHTIGRNAFERRAVKKLTIPATVRTIEDEAFMNADLLKDVTFAEGGLVTIGQRAFLKTGLQSVTLPKSVRTLSNGAFGNCDQLSSITLQEGLTTIGYGAFTETLITGIKLPNTLTSIGYGAFTKCKNLTSINIPASVKIIEDLAFNGCTALVEVNLLAVTRIGKQAFLLCTSLQKIQLPATLTQIGSLAFDSCEKLVEINVDPSSTSFTSQEGILYSKDFSEIYDYPNARAEKTLVLPATVNSIKAGAFARTCITAVTLPAGLKTIEMSAFEECTALKGIQLPNGITKLGQSAFDQCTSLTGDLTIPKSIKTMENQVFRMTALKNVTIDCSANLSEWLFIECKSLETVKINGQLAKIGDSAFFSCTKLTKINLPKTLKVIDSLAFSDCTSLPEISLPSGLLQLGKKSYIVGDKGVFNNCTSLKSIAIPNSVIYMEESAFAGCSSLKSATISRNPKYNLIEAEVFQGCTSLESIIIPKNVITIGVGAFSTSGLTKLTIEPNGCKFIGPSAFQFTKLKEVILPVGVEKIEYYAFNDINALKTITLSSTVKDIVPFVFYKLPSLTRVNLISTKGIDLASFNFEDKAFIDKGAVHVPKNFADAYLAPDGKLYLHSRKLIKDLPVLPKGKKGY
ncbi:MAG TPA: leucine-rich repeat domain-containing protein [Ruminiclostridium sp.]